MQGHHHKCEQSCRARGIGVRGKMETVNRNQTTTLFQSNLPLGKNAHGIKNVLGKGRALLKGGRDGARRRRMLR